MGNDQFKNFQIYQKMYSLSLANTAKYTCQFCEYQAAQKGNLITHHKSVHIGQKFKCQFKNFQIYQKMSSLSSANTAKYTCQLCGYQTFQKRNLTHHEQVVHEGGKFECPECDYQANQKGHLVTHWKSMHMGQKLK